ncbi:MAG: insulinase family protein [Clostridiales bacterium]|nr:insulinase family protein [Clostridiales bacterium]
MEKITLPNGLRILLDRVEGARSCTVSFCIGSGSGYESDTVPGVSHFIEHMLFKGTADRSAFDISKEMDSIGGALNAYTTKEYTSIYARTLAEHTEQAVDIIGDMLCNSKFDEKDIELEKGVIKEEIAMYEDSAEDLCFDKFYESVWSESDLGRNILGTRDSVSSVTREDLIKRLENTYVPERMTVAFCGNFDKDRVTAQCEKFFGSKANTGNLLSMPTAGYTQTQVFVPKDFEQNQLIIGMPGIVREDERYYALNLAVNLLGGANSSRLFQRLREELGLVYSVDAFNASYTNAGVAGISMGLAPSAERKALEETLRIVKEFPFTVTREELSRATEQSVASVVMGLESMASRSSRMARNELLYNRIETEDEIIGKIRSVTLEDLRRVSGEIFDLSRLTVCAVGKGKDAAQYRGTVDEILGNI